MKEATKKGTAIESKKRGIVATFFFCFFFVGMVLSIITLLHQGTLVLHAKHHIPRTGPAWSYFFVAFLAMSQIIFIIAMWRWKKWGVYGFVIGYVILFITDIIIHSVVRRDIQTWVILLIFFFIIRPIWKYFE